MIKILKYQYLIFALIYAFIAFVLNFVFKLENTFLQIAISAFIAGILSPRKKIIQTQSGERKQLTWIFLKKPIFLD